MKSEYIRQIIKGCGREADYIIILKQKKREEAIEKIKEKMKKTNDLGGLYIRGYVEEVELNLFKNGRLLIRGLKEEKELERFTEKLFK